MQTAVVAPSERPTGDEIEHATHVGRLAVKVGDLYYFSSHAIRAAIRAHLRRTKPTLLDCALEHEVDDIYNAVIYEAMRAMREEEERTWRR